MKITLYQIADQYLDDIQKLENTDLNDQCFQDTLESLSGDFEVKSTNIAMFIRNLESSAEQIKIAEDQMAIRRKSIEKRAASIKEYLLVNMQKTGIFKIECPYFKNTLRDNPESVVIAGNAVIPNKYMRQPETPPPAPDKVAIKEALKAGEIIEGCKLERKQSIQIK